ncbi:hypothetical protein GCM10023324_67900 [Streptomyces youssoufiensis]
MSARREFSGLAVCEGQQEYGLDGPQVMRVPAWVRDTVQGSAGSRARRVSIRRSYIHSHASAALAEYLGHSDPGLTLRVYAHLMPSSQERTRKAVAAVFETARPGSSAPDGPETTLAHPKAPYQRRTRR